jgi:hypothetical protein
MSWMHKVIARTSAREGGYDAINPNTDGAGLSFGILQWTQSSGNLGKLLAAMQATDSATFERIFGPSSRTLIDTMRAGGVRSVGGAYPWQEPWASRFRAAGRTPIFQLVQDEYAKVDPHMQAALEVAKRLKVMTERSMAIFFDTAVQQGPNGAKSIAEAARTALLARGSNAVPYADVLRVYVEKCLDRVRRRSPPAEDTPGTWRQVGDEWHRFARDVDLFKAVHRRRTALLTDPLLADTPIPTSSVAA